VTELICVIVSTYERPDALDAVLRGLSQQRDRGFEIVVADDGSGESTRAVIEGWRGRIDRPLAHVRHEHRGFRAGEIRNRAILAAQGDYCVFLDGDCIPRPDFVAQHRALAEPGWFVAGNRILLSQDLTQTVLSGGQTPERWSTAGFAWRSLTRKGVNRWLPALHLALGPLRKAEPERWEGARTCNLAVARGDLLRVDGFDSTFNGWGFEDSDLAVRLIRSGVRRKDGRFATGVVHLWHPENDRSRMSENRVRLDAVIRDTRMRAQHGLSELAPSAPSDTRCAG
jgi:glycosyltransferase involved in cell wall biosynthesis